VSAPRAGVVNCGRNMRKKTPTWGLRIVFATPWPKSARRDSGAVVAVALALAGNVVLHARAPSHRRKSAPPIRSATCRAGQAASAAAAPTAASSV
jgi:hypothetical protein